MACFNFWYLIILLQWPRPYGYNWSSESRGTLFTSMLLSILGLFCIFQTNLAFEEIMVMVDPHNLEKHYSQVCFWVY